MTNRQGWKGVRWLGFVVRMLSYLFYGLFGRFRANSPRWALGEFARCPSVEGEIHQQLDSCSRA